MPSVDRTATAREILSLWPFSSAIKAPSAMRHRRGVVSMPPVTTRPSSMLSLDRFGRSECAAVIGTMLVHRRLRHC
jgi:hypothetical protein